MWSVERLTSSATDDDVGLLVDTTMDDGVKPGLEHYYGRWDVKPKRVESRILHTTMDDGGDSVRGSPRIQSTLAINPGQKLDESICKKRHTAPEPHS